MNGEVVQEERIIHGQFTEKPGNFCKVTDLMVHGNCKYRAEPPYGICRPFQGIQFGCLDIHLDIIYFFQSVLLNKIINGNCCNLQFFIAGSLVVSRRDGRTRPVGSIID